MSYDEIITNDKRHEEVSDNCKPMDEMDDHGLLQISNKTWKPNVRCAEYIKTFTTTTHETEIDDYIAGNIMQYLMTQYGKEEKP